MIAFLKRRTAASSSSAESGPWSNESDRESRMEPAPGLARQLHGLPFAGHRDSSCYAPHTKFLTGSPDLGELNYDTVNPEP